MGIRSRVQAVRNWEWFVPVQCALAAGCCVGVSVYIGATGLSRDINMFLSGSFGAFAVLDVLMQRRIKRYEVRAVEEMERTMVDAIQRAVAKVREYNPDMKIEAGFGPGPGEGGVRH